MAGIGKESFIPEPENNSGYCAFCGNFKKEIGGATPEFLQIYPHLSETGQILNASENFIQIPDIAPLSNDHMLLISKEHTPSIACIADTQKSELESFVEAVIAKMAKFHPNSEIIAFEHGVGIIEGKIVQCGSCERTDHAHLHILPLSNDEIELQTLAKDIASVYGLRLMKTDKLPRINFESTSKYPYLFVASYQNQNAHLLIQDSLKSEIPSQLIRKLLSIKLFGENDQIGWDWRDFIIFHQDKGERMLKSTIDRWKV